MKAIWTGLLAVCMWGIVGATLEKPNIVFVMVDDLGYGDLGCYGQKAIRTPRLDGMASEGMRFTQVYAGSTVCAPSRSVLMTGMHTGHTTVRGNMGKGGVKGLGGGNGRVPLRKEDVTVAEVMMAAGYVTGMVGKWGLGEPNTSGEPNAQGWGEWFGFYNQRRAHDHYTEYLWENGKKVMLKNNAGGAEGTHSHDLFTKWMLDFVRKHREERFFLYVPYCVPHAKYQQVPGAREMPEDWSKDEKSHAAMIEAADRDVGRLLDLLKELKLDEKTIVFFCSDNGAAKRWEGIFDSSGKLRGHKRNMTEGGLRTPMIVRWPGKVPAGRVSDEVWWFADVLPTLARLGGGAVPEGLDGVDVGNLLAGGTLVEERTLYWEFHEKAFAQAVRMGKWKGIRKNGGRLELHDLEKDPGEALDVAAEHPEVASEIAKVMERSRTASKEWPARVK